MGRTMLDAHPFLALLIPAELLLLIARSKDIKLLFKSHTQRTPEERYRAKHGMGRDIFTEAVCFVPASVFLMYLMSPVIISALPNSVTGHQVAVSTLLGMASYGFPWATVRKVISQISLNTLREFATVTPPEIREAVGRETHELEAR